MISARMIRSFRFWICLLFLLILSLACYHRPIDNLDRYIYEGIVRERTQSVESAYDIVKHESPRAEASLVLNSPQHLQEVEPMYTIRPIYLKVIALAGSLLPLQKAITFISAAALFGVGAVVLLWTKRAAGMCTPHGSLPGSHTWQVGHARRLGRFF
jgi:hypothetical protein